MNSILLRRNKKINSELAIKINENEFLLTSGGREAAFHRPLAMRRCRVAGAGIAQQTAYVLCDKPRIAVDDEGSDVVVFVCEWGDRAHGEPPTVKLTRLAKC